LEAAAGNFVLIYMSSEGVKHHFTLIFSDDGVTEEYTADYPIS
jgi:hypothetical protein